MAGFFVDVETEAGTRYGAGPIADATSWSHTRRMNRAGDIASTMPASDAATAMLQLRRYLRCRSEMVNITTAFGRGIIEQLGLNTETETLAIKGGDLLSELGRRSVDFAKLSGPGSTAISIGDALDIVLAACNAQPGPAWTLDRATYESHGDTANTSDTITNVTNVMNWRGREGGPIYGAGIPAGATVLTVDETAGELTISAAATATDTDVVISRNLVYHVYGGESILEAFDTLAELTGTTFALGDDREIVWRYNVHDHCGVWAFGNATPDAARAEDHDDVCVISGLSIVRDSYSVLSEIHPWGAGVGDERLGLARDHNDPDPDPNAATRVAPDGYTIDLETNTIRRDAAATDYGYAVAHQSFGDIGVSLDPDDPDYAVALVAARNMLADAGLEYIRAHSYPLISYKLKIAKLNKEVKPGQSIPVQYRDVADDGFTWVDLNERMIILEATTELADDGVRTPSLVVASIARWPANDRELLYSMLRSIAQDQQHDQPVAHAQRAVSAQQADSVTGIALAAGKTLTVNNSLTLGGTDGKSLTLTGSLTVGADTTISGGGTLALGGFSLTVPATGTAVLTTRQVLAGNGLTGGGDLSADPTLTLGTPGALTVASTNAVSGTSHTHAITSSANPGAAASILATTAAGLLTLQTLVVTTTITATGTIAGSNFPAGASVTGNGTLATGGFTLTVPATGTAALLGAANVFSAAQQMNAKLGLGVAALASEELTIHNNQNAATRARIRNLIASGNTAAAAEFVFESSSGSGFIGCYPADYVSARFQDKLVVGANSTAAGVAIMASAGGQTVDIYAGAITTAMVISSTGFSLTGSITLNAGNIVTDTATGTKIGTATTQKLGFWNKTPVVQQVLSAYSTDPESSAYTAAADGEAKLADLNSLRTAYEALRAAHDDLRSKLITTGIVA